MSGVVGDAHFPLATAQKHSPCEHGAQYTAQSTQHSAQRSVHNTQYKVHKTQFLRQVLRGVVLVHPNVLSDSLNSFHGLLPVKPV